jgi:hypothetical protein
MNIYLLIRFRKDHDEDARNDVDPFNTLNYVIKNLEEDTRVKVIERGKILRLRSVD